jgi:uncharacterized membrane protein YhhN
MNGLWVPLAAALVDWAAVARRWRGLEYVAKPAVMLALLAWLWQRGPWPAPLAAFAVGLVLSLAGDVLLMLPPRFFLGGLVAFLLAHVAYIVGFNWPVSAPPLAALLWLVPISAAASLIIRFECDTICCTTSSNFCFDSKHFSLE